MATTDLSAGTQTAGAPPQIVADRVDGEPGPAWLGWLSTTDHKRVGVMYLTTAFAFLILGGVEALLMRMQLAAADNDLLTPERYNQVLTLHGTTMVFLVVMPLWAGFANYVVPLQIGARDMAFPRLNALSYWLYLAGGLVFYGSVFFSPPEAGWTAYTPLSSGQYIPGNGTDAWIFLIHLTGVSSILGALNVTVTIVNMRARGMGWSRLPLFCWSMIAQAIMILLTLPVIAGAVTLLLTDRHFGTCFYEPKCGGSALLWQHLFWFFGHPEVYIMILPAFGVISEVLPVFARKPIFGYNAIAASSIAIAFLSMLVWAHHMFATPLPALALVFFMLSSMAIGVPTGVKVLNWLATLFRGSIALRTPLYFAAGFLVLFTLGGITGVMLAIFPIDRQVTDTYFVVAHFHFVLVAGSVSAVMAALYFWFPKITGRLLSERVGRLSFWLQFAGFLTTFVIQHSLGLSGMPRRVYSYSAESEWGTENLISTIGAFILGIGVLLTVVNVLWSLRRGRPASPDPWQGNTLEWFSPSPPPPHNFDVIPRVRSVEPMRDIRDQIRALTGSMRCPAALAGPAADVMHQDVRGALSDTTHRKEPTVTYANVAPAESSPDERSGRIQRLVFVADAAVAGVDELPPAVRAVIDAAAEVCVVTSTLPGRRAWLAIGAHVDGDATRGRVLTVIADAVAKVDPDHILIALRSSAHANWQERGLIGHIEERFGLPVTAYAVDSEGHTSSADGPLVVCFDGSGDAEHAIRYAGELFAGRRALVVTVWRPTVALGGLGIAGETAGMVDFFELDEAAAEHADRVADAGVRIALESGLEADPVVVKADGPVWKAILEIADRHDAATIVLGSRGLTGLRSMVLGSVSNAVVHHAERPTLVIRRPAGHV
jgi:cytochrome c oxidase subunit 1